MNILVCGRSIFLREVQIFLIDEETGQAKAYERFKADDRWPYK